MHHPPAPHSADGWYQLGQSLERITAGQSRLDECADHYAKAHAIDPHHKMALYSWAKALDAAGRHEAALEKWALGATLKVRGIHPQASLTYIWLDSCAACTLEAAHHSDDDHDL